MSRKENDKDLDRPRYYSQYWINIARQYALGGVLPSVSTMESGEDDEPFETPVRPATKPANVIDLTPDIDDELPLPRPAAKPAKPRPVEPARSNALTSFADLATLGFGEDAETEELPVGADDDAESVISRIGQQFGEDEDLDVEPDEEEAASLESLEEDEWEEDEEDEDGVTRRRPTRPVKPQRPPRRPDRPF